FALALASRGSTSHAWHVESAADPSTKAAVTTASLMREAARSDNEVESYRLIVTCNTASRVGSIQVTWAPVPRIGMFSSSTDGGPSMAHTVQGTEQMGNGVGRAAGLAAFDLPNAMLPRRSLVLRDLFKDDVVEFSFAELLPSARAPLEACFK